MNRAAAPCLLLAPLLLATALAYWPGLGGPLVLDDVANLEVLSAYGAGQAGALEVITGYGERPLHRPVAMASFLADQVLHGGRVPSLKYHNLMIHLLCGAVLFWLTGRLLDRPHLAPGPRAWWLALGVAAFWLSAPLMVSTVLYTVQRMAQLATLFTLAGLLLYVAGRDHLAAGRRRGWVMVALVLLLCWPLAALSKENGVMLPVLVLVLEAFFLRFAALGDARRPLLLLLGLAAAVPALLALGFLMTHPGWLQGIYSQRPFDVGQRLLTQAWILVDYLLNLFSLPGGSALGIYHDDQTVLTRPFAPPFPGLLLLAWLIIPPLAWRLRRRAVGPLLGGLVFFMTAHLVESTVLPLELYFEHRNYLPATGLLMGMAATVPALMARVDRLRPLLLLALVLMVAANLALTAARADIWSTKASLLDYHLQAHPGSLRVHTSTANLYLAAGRPEQALAHMAKAAATPAAGHHGAAVAIQRLAVACHGGQVLPASRWPRRALRDTPYAINALNMLVTAVEQGRCPAFPTALLLDYLGRQTHFQRPRHRWNLALLRARLAAEAGQPRVAAEQFLAAHALRPARPQPALRAVRLLLDAGATAAARAALEDMAPAAHTWAPALRRDYRRLREEAYRPLAAKPGPAAIAPSAGPPIGLRP